MSMFGHAMLREWMLDADITYLNHGTVGATPRVVLAEQLRLRELMEAQPARFLLREVVSQVGKPHLDIPRMRDAANKVAQFLGARGDDLVFVDNATTGMNAVLQSLQFRDGDEIVNLDHAYGAISYATACVTEKQGAVIKTVGLPFPLTNSRAVLEAITQAFSPRTRLAIIDHITSESGTVLPIAEIAAACRKAGILLLVDGAHAPGAIALDIPSIGADWYVGNLHKWAYAPRGCGILWASPGQRIQIHSPVVSWGYRQGMTGEFDWVGTKDPTQFLSAPAGIAFMQRLGVDDVRSYNHRLAWEGAKMLSARFQTSFVTPEEMIGTMATLPLPPSLGQSKEDAFDLRDALLFEEKIEAQIHAYRGQLWVRISAQIYNEMADYEKFARAIEKRQ